nr:uncharacterized protein LOC106828953 [Equus asinus]
MTTTPLLKVRAGPCRRRSAPGRPSPAGPPYGVCGTGSCCQKKALLCLQGMKDIWFSSPPFLSSRQLFSAHGALSPEVPPGCWSPAPSPRRNFALFSEFSCEPVPLRPNSTTFRSDELITEAVPRARPARPRRSPGRGRVVNCLRDLALQQLDTFWLKKRGHNYVNSMTCISLRL